MESLKIILEERIKELEFKYKQSLLKASNAIDNDNYNLWINEGNFLRGMITMAKEISKIKGD